MDILRLPAEKLYENEIKALIKEDKYDIPVGWQMSPRAVLNRTLTKLLGGILWIYYVYLQKNYMKTK